MAVFLVFLVFLQKGYSQEVTGPSRTEYSYTRACGHFRVDAYVGAHVRTSPGVSANNICGGVLSGEGLDVFGFSGNWVQVRKCKSGSMGYLHKTSVPEENWNLIQKNCSSQSTSPVKYITFKHISLQHRPKTPKPRKKTGKTNCGRTSFCKRFTPVWNRCSQGCDNVQPWIFGDRKHCRRRSCHNSGQAIDIHTLNCGGKQYKGTSQSAKPIFDKIAQCLRGHGTTLWRVKSHHDHIHFNFRGCNKRRGCNY